MKIDDFIKTGEFYALNIDETSIVPCFKHPHDEYIKELCAQNPGTENVRVQAKVIDRTDSDNTAELCIELTPNVFAYTSISGTMRGDYWPEMSLEVIVDLEDYDKTNKVIPIYID